MSITVPLAMGKYSAYSQCAWPILTLYLALFHASNSQFLYLASRQKSFARMSSLGDHKPIDEKTAQEVGNSHWKRVVNGVERADNIQRTLICIGVGMAVQASY
jgi:hypothetical protein